MSGKMQPIDAFEQVRDVRGALPAKKVVIVEDDQPARLRFTLRSADEPRTSESKALSLEMLGEFGADADVRADVEELATQMGPLFGTGGPESLESWQLAAKAAQLGMTIHAAVQQDAAGTLAATTVRKLAVMDANRGKRRGCWYWMQVPVDAGGGGEYRAFMPVGALQRELGSGCWAFAQVKTIPNSLDSLVVGVLQLDFKEASLADARVVAKALRREGLPSVDIERETSMLDVGTALIGSVSDIAFKEEELAPDDAPVLTDILRMMAQAHMEGVRLDVIKSSPEQQFLAFPALLGYLWFDFVRRGKEVKVGICVECGLPFGKSARGGSRKRFCSQSCSAKFRSREKREKTK